MTAIRLAFLGATVLAAASALSAANAADVYAPPGSLKDAPVDYRPAIAWTGFYVGAHAGSTIDAQNTFELDGAELNEDLDDTGLAGFQIGYNWQSPHNLVLGVEGDMSFPFDDIGIDYFASIRGRLGYAAGNALLYATGGVAFLGVSDDVGGDDDTQTGYVVGGGLDYKLRQNISVGVEGLYYNFEDDIGGGVDQTLEFWSVRARLNYHFGGGGYGEPLR
jgi:outer membrane immunogenic protein